MRKWGPFRFCSLKTTLVLLLLMNLNFLIHASDVRNKPRVIATTDGEIDDKQSMIRFLLYSCDYDVAGIIEVNSKYQKSGHSDSKWIQEELIKYNAVLPNLLKHNPNYPSASYLASVMRVGNENIDDLYVTPDKMTTTNTEGEKLMIQVLLDDDPRPVHIGCWGGANTIASALWRLKYSGQYSKAQFDYAVSKVRIYCILYQDGGCQWIEDNIKEAYIAKSYGLLGTWDYRNIDKRSKNPEDVKTYLTSTWLNAHVKTGHGLLGEATPQTWVSEGDTPSFMNFVDNGLEAHADYSLGGWGGRFAKDSASTKPNFESDLNVADDSIVMYKSYWRWLIDIQNDFQARMDWCVQPEFKGANHPPKAVVFGSNAQTATAGSTVNLNAAGTFDPDGNELSFSWWQYYDVDNCSEKVIINDSASKSASFVVPNESGKEVHIILEVSDNGHPTLKGYQRIIYRIKK